MIQVLLVIIASLLAAAYAASGMSSTADRPLGTAVRLRYLLVTALGPRPAADPRNACGCPWFTPSLAWVPATPAAARRRPWPFAGPPGGGTRSAGPPTGEY